MLLSGVVQIKGVDMSNGMPSMTALLGLLALAGYQNRDKISEMLKGGFAIGIARVGDNVGSSWRDA
jgi:hypothetical protein